jgi:Aldo/keto reductase family
LGVSSSQVALSWIANRPGVTAHIVGARTLKLLADNLAAADLTLDEEATAALDAVSAPKSNGCPYGVFGAWQRGRWLGEAGGPAVPFTGGSKHPRGRSSGRMERIPSRRASIHRGVRVGIDKAADCLRERPIEARSNHQENVLSVHD